MDLFSVQSLISSDGVHVFWAQFDSHLEVTEVQPKLRNDYVNAATDPNEKRRRFAVWRLLDCALLKLYGKGVADFDFERQVGGKWVCSEANVHFSLSHSGNVVAVALFDRPVGVDVQSICEFERHNSMTFARRTLTSSELAEYVSLPQQQKTDFLAEKWCAKESIFKLTDGSVFAPSTIAVCDKAQLFRVLNGEYILAVATQ